MTGRSTAESIDAYIAEFPSDVQVVLEQMRTIIKTTAPGTVETISYAIPTFDLNGKHLAHFAGYRGHVGFYPTGRGIEVFEDELAAYKTGKGSVQFPLGTPLPADLIERMVRFLVEQQKVL